MNRNKLITVAALAVLAFACSETVGGVMQDAGTMLADAGDMLADAGDMMQPDAGAQDTPVSCNKQQQDPDRETKFVWRWAEFPIADPGETEVTVCTRYDDSFGPPHRSGTVCNRSKAQWKEGTRTGVLSCGVETDDGSAWQVESITVHN